MRIDPINWAVLQGVDGLRRLQGASLDALGFGPLETSYETVFSQPGVTLRRYGSRDSAGPLLVMIPAPIKRPYIFDLAPEVSVVRRCLDQGARVFLVEWQPAAPDFGLAEFADRLLLASLDAAGDEPPILIAHSLGGLLAAVFAALHPERIRALVLLAAPLHFGRGAGVFGELVAEIELAELPGFLPGSFLSLASLRASPETFAWERSLDLLQSSLDPAALRNHLRVERWTLDEFAMPRRLFAELAQLLGREDRFVRGSLRVGRQLAAPSRIDVPVLCVVDPRCRIAPRQAVQPFLDAIATGDKSLLEYEREVGVCLHHVGPLVGRRAHRELWPKILRWVGARWRDAAAVEVAGKPASLKPTAGNAEENREGAEKNGIATGNG